MTTFDAAPVRSRPRGRRGRRRRTEPPAVHPGDDRLRELRPGGRARGAGFGADQQVRRGLPGPPLLRRLRARRRRRAARHRPREGAVRRRARQRAAALGRAGQRRRDVRRAQARRHDPRPRPGARRPPDARDEDQFLGQALQRRRLPRRQRDRDRRPRRDRAPRRRAQAEADHRRLVRVPASARLRRVPPHRRPRRGAADGGHGALRRAGRGRAAPVAGAARRHRHHDHAQDPRRPARRLDPVPPGAGEEDQLGGVPRPAGRAAGARHRGQGRRAEDRRERGVQGASAAHPRGLADPGFALVRSRTAPTPVCAC